MRPGTAQASTGLAIGSWLNCEAQGSEFSIGRIQYSIASGAHVSKGTPARPQLTPIAECLLRFDAARGLLARAFGPGGLKACSCSCHMHAARRGYRIRDMANLFASKRKAGRSDYLPVAAGTSSAQAQPAYGTSGTSHLPAPACTANWPTIVLKRLPPSTAHAANEGALVH